MKKLSLNLQNILLFVMKIIVGILLIANPAAFTVTIICLAGVGFIVLSVLEIVKYFKARQFEINDKLTLTAGIIYAVIGLVLLLGANQLISIFALITVLYAAILLAAAFFQIKIAFEMKKNDQKRWILQIVSGVIIAVIALVILLNPFKTTEMLWQFTGVSLIVAAVIDAVAVIMDLKKTTDKK